MSTTYIYGLFDPRDPEKIMYVGKGSAKRVQHHWYYFQWHDWAVNTLLRRWFKRLKIDEVEPGWRFLAEDVVDWERKEREQIAIWRAVNPELCNIGPGGNAPNYSTEERRRIAASIKNWGANGGKRTKELHAEEQREWCKKASHVANGKGGRVTQKLHPEMASRLDKKYGPKVAPIGCHYRHHVYRGIVDQNCQLCCPEKAR